MPTLCFLPRLLFGWLIFYAPIVLSQNFCELGDFALGNGQTIKQCRIGFRTFGRLNEAKDNAILFPTYFMGKSDALQSNVGGKGHMLDSTRYFIILTDALGNGVSSSPSNSTLQPGSKFPLFTIADMVRSQEAMIRKQWGIEKLHAVIGISMGGMQAFQWMAAFPEKVGKMISLVGTPKLGFSDLLLWQSEIQPIEKALQTNGNLQQAMETTVLIHAYALYTPSWRNKNQKTADFQGFIAAEIQKSATLSPLDWAWQAKAMMAHNAYKVLSLDKLGAILKTRGLIVYALQDMMVSPQACADLIQYSGAAHIVLSDDCGHLAIGCNIARITERVRAFLQQK